MSTNYTVAPETTLDPRYTANAGGDQTAIKSAVGINNPCNDEWMNDVASQSEIIQQTWRDALEAINLPSDFPSVSVATETDNLNADIATLEEKAMEVSLSGRMSDVVSITGAENEASAAKEKIVYSADLDRYISKIS